MKKGQLNVWHIKSWNRTRFNKNEKKNSPARTEYLTRGTERTKEWKIQIKPQIDELMTNLNLNVKHNKRIVIWLIDLFQNVNSEDDTQTIKSNNNNNNEL